MIVIVGIIVVLGSIAGGYYLANGTFGVLFQPAEMIIIAGAAFGSLLIASTPNVLVLLAKGVKAILSIRSYGKEDFIEVLSLLNRLLLKIRREGLASVEPDIEYPQNSAIFQRARRLIRDEEAVHFICDTFRVYLITGDPVEIESLMQIDLDSKHNQEMIPPTNLAKVAESLPGLGIVAAVLGVVLTMGKISAPPDVLGHSIGGAMVGTFLGVLACYGFVGPMATNLENKAHEREAFLHVIRSTLVGAVNGATPMIALEYGRRSVPSEHRPTFFELEERLKSS